MNGVRSPSRTSMVNETTNAITNGVGCGVDGGSNNNNHASSSSLMESEDMDGRDNPAFETDDPGGSLGKQKQNGKRNGELVVANNNKSSTGQSVASNGRNGSGGGLGGDVEMVPLNPNVAAAGAQQNGNGNNGMTMNNKDQKVALDTMYSDYFRPVNTRRKLLRGEKLYVTRDQRAHSRGWKWIAFWGGVFTFVAAALLTGILAATGIIMSKSEPTFGSSHSTLVGNGNHSSDNDTYVHDHDFHHNSNRNDVTTTEHLTTTSSTESPRVPLEVDFGNSLDDNSWTTTTTTEGHHTSTDHIVYWLNHLNMTGNDLGVETTTTITTTTTTTTEHPTDVDAVSHSEPTENFDEAVASVNNISNTINDRGRSLDEAVTVVPLEDDDETTLFPTLKSVDDENESRLEVVVPSFAAPINETETTAKSQTISFYDELDSPVWNMTTNNNVTNDVLNFENEKHHAPTTTEEYFLYDQTNSTVSENEKHHTPTTEANLFDQSNSTVIENEKQHTPPSTEENLTNLTIIDNEENSTKPSTEASLLLNQTNSTVIEHEVSLGNDTVEETTNGTVLDARNAVASRDNGTDELVEPNDIITQDTNTSTSFEVSSNETMTDLTSTDATTTTMTTPTTVAVHDTTWTQMSNLSLTPSDVEIDDLFNETSIPLNVSLNATASEADFNYTITSRNMNNNTLLDSTNVVEGEEDELINNSTVSLLATTKEVSTNATTSVTNETTTTTMSSTTNETVTTTTSTTNKTNTTTVNSEVTTHNMTTQDVELSKAETTQLSVEKTEELLTSTAAAVHIESSNSTSANATAEAAMVTENTTISLFEEESDDANLAEV